MTKEQFIALGLTEDQATKAAEASKEELASFIPKARFDEVNEVKKQLETDIKERDTQLETLKTTAGDAEALKTQITQLQADNSKKDEDYQAKLKDLTLSNAIKLAVAGKVHDEDIVSGLVDKTKLILGEDGKIVGLDEQISSLQEGRSFLFKEATDPVPTPGFQRIGNPAPNDSAGANSAVSAAFGNVATK